MRHVVILRHGNYGPDRRLDETGRDQMARMGRELRRRFGDEAIVGVFHSPAPRAEDSAKELAVNLKPVASVPLEFLWSEHNRPTQNSRVRALLELQPAEVDVIVLVTHYEYVVELPRFLGREMLEVHDFPGYELPKGSAWVIDLQDKTCEEINVDHLE